jgi:FAD/FMN-containing dehydrogenase
LASIVKILRQNKERFAVKSGGHNPNVGLSSISGGPLISLKAIDHVNYDAASKTAKIGPGNRWSDVVRKLEPYNVTAASGRVGNVGVGGYTMGGKSNPATV